MKNKINELLFITCLLPFIGIFCIPAIGFFQNYDQFIRLTLNHLISNLGILFFSSSLIILIFAYIISFYKRTWSIIAGILVGISFSILIQSSFLNWNFRLLNGQEIHYNLKGWQSLIELTIWSSFIIISIVFSLRNSKIFKLLIKSLYVFGFASLMINFILMPKEFLLNKANYIDSNTSESPLFSFHPSNNKILIILDTFQSDLFGEIAEKWPNEVSFLKGFTYYPDTVGGFPTTKASIPFILTGKHYHNQKPFEAWLISKKELTINNHLNQKGYQVSIASIVPSLYKSKLEQKIYGIHHLQVQFLQSLHFGFFKESPIILKNIFYPRGEWINQKSPQFNDFLFIQKFNRLAKVKSNKIGEFKIFHFAGLHAPSQVDENLNFKKILPCNRTNYIRHARGVLKLINIKLDVLKKLGIYDSTEILIIGDHGKNIRPRDLKGTINYTKLNYALNSHTLGDARPLFLYKPANSTSHLAESNNPMSLGYVVCILSNNARPFNCENYKKATLGVHSKRYFFNYIWDNSWDSDYLPKMTEFIIKGDVRNLNSWSSSKKIYLNPNQKTYKPKYKFNQLINLGKNFSTSKYLVDGWGNAEHTHRWTDGNISQLSFYNNNFKEQDLEFKLFAAPFLYKDLKHQSVDIYVNNYKLTTWLVDAEKWYRVVIPKNLTQNNNLAVKLVIKKAMSPYLVGQSNDRRELGIRVSKLIINTYG